MKQRAHRFALCLPLLTWFLVRAQVVFIMQKCTWAVFILAIGFACFHRFSCALFSLSWVITSQTIKVLPCCREHMSLMWSYSVQKGRFVLFSENTCCVWTVLRDMDWCIYQDAVWKRLSSHTCIEKHLSIKQDKSFLIKRFNIWKWRN